MSCIDIDLARLVSPTLRRRRSRSTKQAVRTRERMAMTIGAQAQGNSRHMTRATPFIDENIEDEGGPGWGWGPLIALLLACASIATGFIIFTASQNT